MTETRRIGETVALALEGLASAEDVERRVKGMEALAVAVGQAVDLAVQAFLTAEPNVGYLLFERLGRFGNLPVEPLVRALPAAEGETRTLTAIALLALGSELGLSDVVGALDPDDPSVCLAADVLSRQQEMSAISALEVALARSVPKSDVAHCLTQALDRLRP